jgi:MYXO-CTERM domain-containing protein
LRQAIIAAALAAGAFAAAPAARAEPCGKPDLVDMVPPDGAVAVPPNATLAAHYTSAADYLGEEVVLVRPDMSEQVLPAIWDATEQRLSATPPQPLEPATIYEVRWPALRGLNAAAPGVGDNARFTTGTTFEVGQPTFTGVAGLSWDLERINDECVDELVERFVFDINLGAAQDDGGTNGLTLMLFQTSGPTVMDMPKPIPARAWPTDGKSAQVKLSTGDAVGDICFAGIVRDTTGQLSQSGDVEVCVHTTAPPFFRGCSVAGARGGDGWALASLALAALVLRRRTRTR